MIWTVVIVIGVIVGLIVVGIAAIYIYHVITESRKEKNVRANGRPVMASLVMANNTAYDPNGDPEFPGVVVFGFYQPSAQLAAQLRSVAEKIYQLYTAEPHELGSVPPTVQQVAATIKDHNYKESRRTRLPPEIVGDHAIYFADIWIRRELLPNQWENMRTLACMASGDHEGQVILLSPSEISAQTIYQSAM